MFVQIQVKMKRHRAVRSRYSGFITYRPFEVKRHSERRALGDGVGVGAQDLCERGAVRARRLRVNVVLRVFEAHAEKNEAALGLVGTDAAGAGEGIDLELEDSVGESLKRRKRR